MAKQLFVFCDGPHAGPCPNRFVRLLGEIAQQGVTYARGCSAADVFRQIAKQGRDGEDMACEAANGEECPYGADKPRFDEERGELWARGKCLHSFRALTGNEVAILKKLQANHWCPRVFRALGRSKSKKYGGWLKTTVCRLNECQGPWLIEFHSHPSDGSVSWKWRVP